MILSDNQIAAAMVRGEIVVRPFRPEALRVNSYDVHLGATLLVSARREIDAARDEQWDDLPIGPNGIMLEPGRLYLAVTREYTESHAHVPYLDGKSSVGRLGCFIHATAGRGDVGFCGHWTMEISVVQPLRVYAGMPIGQLTWHECGAPSASYTDKAGSSYAIGSHAAERPVPSALWKKLRPPADDSAPPEVSGPKTIPADRIAVVAGPLRCSRCGDDHEDMIFSPLTVPLSRKGVVTHTHWAPCPKTGEPICAIEARDNVPAPPDNNGRVWLVPGTLGDE